MEDVSLKATLDGNRTVTGKASVGGVDLDFEASKTGGRGSLDKVDCGRAYRAFKGLLTDLDGISLEGSLSLSVLATGSRSEPKIQFRMDNKCRVTSIPVQLNAALLKGRFERKVWDADGNQVVEASGRNTEGWTSLREVSQYVQLAVMATEDPGFLNHRGMDRGAIENAIRDDLREGKFLRGASTLSMQLAKNLWLDRKKNVSRKLEEAILATYLEQELRKDEILEVYLNVVEFAPGVYGIGRAAKHYFKTSPKELSLSQSLFLSLMLPRPKGQHFESDGRATAGRMKVVRSVMQAMRLKKTISDEECAEAMREWVVRGEPRPRRDASPTGDDGPDMSDWE